MSTPVRRPSSRGPHEMRAVRLEPGAAPQAEGSCLAVFGRTRVLCTASIEERLPAWRRGQGAGWVTAEYGMLPRATGSRTRREAVQGRQSGRTQEIQRLIGRAMRASIDLKMLGERQILIDCDVLNADGGTRTAAITGSWVALWQAGQWMQRRKLIETNPVQEQVAAVSCGLYRGHPVCDLDYAEDKAAAVDANFVINGSGAVVEIQAASEDSPFAVENFEALFAMARGAIAELIVLQREAQAQA